jgi:ATP-dependent Zn protease
MAGVFDNANIPRPALIARAVFQPGSPDRVQKLEAENTQLKERVTKLESKYKKLKRMVSAMWDAPGMPGANAHLAELYPDEQTK